MELMANPPPLVSFRRVLDVLLLRTVSRRARILLCLLTVAWLFELLHLWVAP